MQRKTCAWWERNVHDGHCGASVGSSGCLAARAEEREADRSCEDEDDHEEREPGRNLPDVGEEHLRADPDENDREPVGEVGEPVHHPREEEVERPQAEEGKGVCGEDDERVVGDREDRGDRVDREDEVGGREDDDDGSGDGRSRPDALHAAQHDVPFRMHFLARVARELDARRDEEEAEEVDREVERVEEGGARDDEDRPHHEGHDDPDRQESPLLAGRDRERGEDQGEDEDVVDREASLDQVAGEVLLGRIRPLPGAHDERERHAEREPEDAPDDGAAEGDPAPAEEEEVDGQETRGSQRRGQPRRGRPCSYTMYVTGNLIPV